MRTLQTGLLYCLLILAVLTTGCSSDPPQPVSQAAAPRETDGLTESAAIESSVTAEEKNMPDSEQWIPATFGAGCYWCTEAVFQRLAGVENVVSGFMGGETPNPTYEQVCLGTTGHAEVIHFDFDPNKIRFEDLLEVFFKTHDPTTLNRQGADVGTQYRSVVFYHSDEQRRLAEKYKAKLDEAGVFDDPIVTAITAASEFYAAKSMHQNFYNNNPNQGYCSYVIRPKVEKLEAAFAEKLRDDTQPKPSP